MLRRLWIDPKTMFNLTNRSYLIGIYQETAREIVIKKAAQLGLSEWAISYALHACDQRNLDVLYVMPTVDDVSDFSQARFGPALEASPYLSSLVVSAADASKRGADKVMLKRIRNSFLYFRGGTVKDEVSHDGQTQEGKARQLKSIPADALILDEVDEMDTRAPDIARKRLGDSQVAEVRTISTPTYPDVGIDAGWKESDQREWFLKCDHCGTRQFLTIHHIVIEWDSLERPVLWHGQAEDRAWPACVNCQKEINRLGPGEWVATYPGRETAGFHPTRLISPVANLLKIIEILRKPDETKRKETYNQDLGETYVPKGGQLTDAALDDCRRNYAHGPFSWIEIVDGQEKTFYEPTFMGADVGKVIHAIIRGRPDPETGERPQRWAGEVDTFEELGRLMRRFNVACLVIDANPETSKCRELQDSFPAGVVWLAYYDEEGTDHVDEIRWDLKKKTVHLDRTRTLDTTYARFTDKKNILPANARAIKDYYAHLKAPVRTIEINKRTGQPIARYIRGSADHLAHAENYCMAATRHRAGVLFK